MLTSAPLIWFFYSDLKRYFFFFYKKRKRKTRKTRRFCATCFPDITYEQSVGRGAASLCTFNMVFYFCSSTSFLFFFDKKRKKWKNTPFLHDVLSRALNMMVRTCRGHASLCAFNMVFLFCLAMLFSLFYKKIIAKKTKKRAIPVKKRPRFF